MSRKDFEDTRVKKRCLDWGTITFNDKHHITVKTPEVIVIFHRYGASKGNYGASWRRFRGRLVRAPLCDIYAVHKYAYKYDVSYYVKEFRAIPRGAHD